MQLIKMCICMYVYISYLPQQIGRDWCICPIEVIFADTETLNLTFVMLIKKNQTIDDILFMQVRLQQPAASVSSTFVANFVAIVNSHFSGSGTGRWPLHSCPVYNASDSIFSTTGKCLQLEQHPTCWNHRKTIWCGQHFKGLDKGNKVIDA